MNSYRKRNGGRRYADRLLPPALIVGVLMAALILAACGSSSSSSSSGATASGESGSGESAPSENAESENAESEGSEEEGEGSVKKQVLGKELGTCKINECNVYPKKVDMSTLQGKTIGLMGLVPTSGITRFVKPLEACVKENGGKTAYVNVNGDVSKAPAVLEEWLSQGFAGIAVDAVELAGYKSFLEAAKSKGVPVIGWAAGSSPSYVAIAANEFKDGELDAKYIAEQYPEGGTVLGVSNPEVSALRERIEGAEYEFAKHPNIDFVEKTIAEITSTEANKVTSAYLQSEPNVIAVLAGFGEPALGAEGAVKAAGSEAIVVSADGSEEEYALMANPSSSLKMTASDGHEFGGRLSCEIIAAMIGGEEPPAQSMIVESFGPVTAENLPAKGTTNTTPRAVFELPASG